MYVSNRYLAQLAIMMIKIALIGLAGIAVWVWQAAIRAGC